MNEIYGRVWSHAKQAWVVTSELASTQGKKDGRRRLRGAMAGTVLTCSLVMGSPVLAQEVTIERNGDICTVRVAGDETGKAVDCAVFEQASAVAPVVADGAQVTPMAVGDADNYFAADGARDGSDDAVAAGTNAVAAGASSVANGVESSAYGFQSDAEGDYATALGGSSLALGTGSTAVGNGATALGEYSIASGYGSVASADYATALGEGSQAVGNASTALGAESLAQGADSVSVGAGSFAGDYATATGTLSYAGGYGSAAFGDGAWADNYFAMAMGANSTSLSIGGIAIGTGSYVDMLADHAIAIGNNVYAYGKNSIAMGGLWTTAGADGAIAIGGTMACEGFMCIEQNTAAWGVNSLALGAGATAQVNGATAVGAGSQANGMTSTALGQFAYANSDNAVAIGARAIVWGNNSVAIGADSYADRDNTVSVGNSWGTTRQITNVAAGTEANDAVNKDQLDAVAAVAANAIGYDDAVKGRVTLAGAGGTVIDNVAAGTLSATSSEAINGSQLFDTNNRVTVVEGRVDNLETQLGNFAGTIANAVSYDDANKDVLTLDGAGGTTIGNVKAGTDAMDAVNMDQLSSVAAMFGGGATFDGNGMFMPPSYMIQGSSYGNVGNAFMAIDGVLSGINNRLSSLETGAGLPGGTGNGLAIGNGSHANDGNDTAVGNGSTVGAANGTALGNNSTIDAAATNAVAVGADSNVTAANGTAIGQGASVTATGAVAIGQGSVANEANTVSVGSVGNERKVTNVAAGTNATDAVNLSQMQAGDLAAVASARTYTDTTATQTLTSANAYTDSRFTAMTDQFTQFSNDVWNRLGQQDQRIDRQGAMSSAMMNMAINAAGSRSPRGRVAIGAGWQNGESALSVGYAKQIGERASFSLGGAFSSDDSSAGVGFGFDL
ncbi:ESPR-type extended signal peptide-containing protein [Lysobacter tyrosinilyticus]